MAFKLYQWFHNYYQNYYSADPTIMAMVELKEAHSIRVANCSRDLAVSIGLSEEQVQIAETIGLLHDISRAEQAQLKTFNDSVSFDHGDKAVLRLQETQVLDRFSENVKEIIFFAIQHHNKLSIPETSRDKLQFAKIIRDADKLDIFRNIAPVKADQNYSPELVSLLLANQPLPYSQVKTTGDRRLLRLGWFYDLNYQWTLSLLVAEGYAGKLLEALPDNQEPIQKIKDNFRKFINKNLPEGHKASLKPGLQIIK